MSLPALKPHAMRTDPERHGGTLSRFAGRTAVPFLSRVAVAVTFLAPVLSARGAAEPAPAAWSQARSLCDAGKADEGWRALARAEKAAGKTPLPAAYWREVLACAARAGMPAHALRAGKMLDDAKQATPEDRAAVEKVRAAVRVPQPDAVIPAEEAWIVRERKGGGQFVSGPCGFAFESRVDAPFLPPVQKRGCSVRTWAAPPKGKQGLRPSIVVIARVPAENETLERFAGLFLPSWKPAKLPGVRCPAARCAVYANRIPGIYGKDGDGVGLAVVFERDEPQFPGLVFEEPGPSIKPKGGDAGPVYARFRGKLHYLVMLESASSVADRAKADFRQFLQDLRVE